MRMTFLGAAGEVTGSCTLLETGRARVLIDFGMFQGDRQSDEKNLTPAPINAPNLDAVVLSHAHIDHSGRLPLLPSLGYRGQIFATPATIELTALLLEDSAELQENDARRETRRNAARGDTTEVRPLYARAEVPRVMKLFEPVAYDSPREIAPGVTLRFTDAGHILGSASIQLRCVDEQGNVRTIIFSADVGQKGTALLNDPQPPVTPGLTPDLIVLESTYGDRDHRSMSATLDEFSGILHDIAWNKEKALIPAFAVGRSQTLLYHISEYLATGRVAELRTYLDSPLAGEATKLYEKHFALMDAQTQRILQVGRNPLAPANIICTCTSEESRQLNELRGAMVIIAGSGMCSGGRILHHFRHNLYKRDVRVIITGFQPRGGLGRRLIDRHDSVRVLGEDVPVRATIHTLGGFSAHAGQSGLVEWLAAFRTTAQGPTPRVVLNHGEDLQREKLRDRIRQQVGWLAELPAMGETLTL